MYARLLPSSLRGDMRQRPLVLVVLVASLLLVSTQAFAQFVQQGSKLVGADAIGSSQQGRGVAASSDGSTVLVGVPGDNGGTRGLWIFTRSSGTWTQEGAKLVATGGGGLANVGFGAALSAE